MIWRQTDTIWTNTTYRTKPLFCMPQFVSLMHMKGTETPPLQQPGQDKDLSVPMVPKWLRTPEGLRVSVINLNPED